VTAGLRMLTSLICTEQKASSKHVTVPSPRGVKKMRKFIAGFVCGVLGFFALCYFKGNEIAEFIEEKIS
jgi:hypothetical protein